MTPAPLRRAAALHVFWPAFTLDATPRDKGAKKDSGKSIEDQIKDRDKRLKEVDDFFADIKRLYNEEASPCPPLQPISAP